MTRYSLVAPALTAALLVVSAAASAQATPPDARARYEQEREKCMTNNTQDSVATCLREANNALDASRKGDLTNPGPAASDNATQRCAAFATAAEKAECMRRVETPVSGSVSGGGVLRQSTTTTIVPAPAPTQHP
ncbi:MAG: hypothetical protein KKH21_19905 [Gammaproteobacteria bacterium]|jgi:hypothetical protein|nr:hypothetical protein [Gammaproteobacteria bacterium]MBU0827195.1 hypothetical protein [Gammaproteobacteria bacterium]MBU0893130.1 hypothetical protein [Gammaproteobacteria bacterium]MBU1818065.1 hypothetical protein [Gammaproteobacteria bacterium]